MALLPLANQITPLSSLEESIYMGLKFSILGIGFISLILVSKDIISHIKFK